MTRHPVQYLLLTPVLVVLAVGSLSAQDSSRSSREVQRRIGDTGWDPFRVYLYDEATLDELRGTWEIGAGREVFELAHVILALSPFAERTVRDDDYARDIEEWFGPFRDHPLIQEISTIEPDNYSWYNSFRLNAYIYCFDGEWVFLRVCEPMSHIYGRVANQFAQHAELIVEFVWDTDYRRFFSEHTAYYDRLEADFRSRVPLQAMWDWLEARYPGRVDRYEIAFPAAGFGVHHTNKVDLGDDFTLGILFLEHVSQLPEDELYRAHRMVFTEIDHRYDTPISRSDVYGYREQLDGADVFGADLWVDRERADASYATGSRVFAEYMTWAMFELWAAEHYDAETMANAREDVAAIMRQRGFVRYEDFAAELTRLYAAREGISMLPLYDDLIEWARASVVERTLERQ